VAAATGLWALSAVLVKVMFVSRQTDPVVLVQFRLGLACLFLGLVLGLLRPRTLRIRLRDVPFLFVYGSVGLALVQYLYYVAIREGSVVVAIFLQYLAPVFTALYEILFDRRRPRAATYAVLAMAIGGTALLLLGRPGAGLATTALGVAAGLGSAVTFAFYSTTGRHAVRRFDSWALLFWGLATGSLLWAVVSPPWVVLAQPWTAAEWGFFVYLGIVSCAIPFGLFLWGLNHIGPTSAVVTATLEPVWAALLVFLILGDALAPAQMAGCALILAAVVSLRTVPGAALEDSLVGPGRESMPPGERG